MKTATIVKSLLPQNNNYKVLMMKNYISKKKTFNYKQK